jgi:hypothetical protein
MLRGNKLLLALLLPIFVLAFCFAAFALDESDFIIVNGDHFTPDEWAAKQAEAVQKTSVEGGAQQEVGITAVNPDFNIDKETILGMNAKPRIADKSAAGRMIPAPTPNIFFEDFETTVPPTGWDYVQTNATSTWQIDSYDPYSGTWSVACFRAADPGPYDQDEWLITPSIDLSAKSSYNWILEFYWYGQYTYMVTNDTQDFEVWISTDGGANFNTKLWDETTDGAFTTWAWNKANIDLSAYLTETDVVFGFRTVGTSPAEVGFDYMSVRAPAMGRCCYGDPTAPSCADETQADCLAYADFLSWDEGLDCTTPCPAAGFGDNCTNPITATFPADFVSDQWADIGNYTCGRVDDYDATCMDYYDGGEDIVYEFTATEDIYINITVDPKGTTYAGFSLNTGCPPNDCFVNVANSYNSTPFSANNVILPAGTYYLMIDTWPSPDCIPNFDLTIDYLGAPPPAPDNDDCADAEYITVPSTVSGTQVGATIDCPGLLDWNAVWYYFDLNTPSDCNNLTIDYAQTVADIYTVGVIVRNDCVCDENYILYNDIDWGYDGYHPLISWNGLPNGTYYFPVYAVDAADGPLDFIFDIASTECPPAPDNDDCSGAIPLTLGVPVSGYTDGATVDCPSLFTDGWYGVWYSITLSSSTNCNNVSASYCGSIGTNPSTVSATLIAENSEPDCCDAASQWFYTSGAFDCPNGWPQIYWDGLPDGTYYYIVAFGAGPTSFDFVLTMDAVECPPPEPGDNCSDPLKVTISGSGDLPYVDNNYTCGRGNFTSATCLSSYDGGEDIFYEITVNTTMTLKFTLDPQGTTWTGMALGDACPPAGTYYTDCLAEVHSSSGSPKGFMFDAAPGTYYLMIDTYPSPDCIPSFTLTIEEFIPTPGDNCTDPIKVNLPSDSPFEDIDQYTCGRIDVYDATCMSSYDGGEDILYEVNVDEAGYYEFIMDPKGTTWTGMGLGADCPPPGSTYSDCIAEVTDYSSSPHGFVVYLTPATYYLMIDTYPSPDCIPAFDLFINFLAPPALEYDQTLIQFCNVGADESGCATLNLGNSGDVDLTYQLLIQYGTPPVKEIDGANISTTDGFVPGATADVLFTIANASSDAEWIDEFTMTFPTGVTVNSAQTLDCASGDLVWDGTTGNGVTVTWTCDDPPNGCMYSNDVEDFIVNLTFDPGLTGSFIIDYTISGDDWGSDPHDISGSFTMTEDNPLYNWVSISPESGTIPGGKGTQAIEVCYSSAGLDPGTYFASVVINHNGGLSPITIPVVMTIGDDHQPAAMILIDRSGSMALEDAYGDSRLLRAKALAHTDADDLLGQGYQVAVMAMNETFGMVMMTDFSTDPTTVHDAIDNIVDPRHDTPLAAAMCEAHCHLADLGCGVTALYTYTDGLENCSLNFTMCQMCDYCYRYTDTGWNFDCDPTNPASCTDWQLCLAEVFSMNAMTTVNYFGSPINPFTKGVTPPEDLYFLKYTADATDGEFHYFADAAFVPGDANGDGSINVSDAVFIINYVFVAGEAPSPLESGDANCDSSVNVSDAVYLINYIFVSGPAPNNCQ